MSQTATAAREPLLRIAKREGTTMPQKIAVRAIAILLALVVDALFIFFVTGLNPLSVYGVMWSGTFANMTRFSWMLRDLSTLLCVGIALAPAFKMRFWNCGGEGQILIGGLTAASSWCIRATICRCRCCLPPWRWAALPRAHCGLHPRVVQVPLEHERDAVHFDDELRCYVHCCCMTNIMRGQASSSAR